MRRSIVSLAFGLLVACAVEDLWVPRNPNPNNCELVHTLLYSGECDGTVGCRTTKGDTDLNNWVCLSPGPTKGKYVTGARKPQSADLAWQVNVNCRVSQSHHLFARQLKYQRFPHFNGCFSSAGTS
uniref:Secreted protein n=1 Tax=Ditylenchus dipsaci TaxID=166011 RepID=A0A915DIC4_9BILA